METTMLGEIQQLNNAWVIGLISDAQFSELRDEMTSGGYRLWPPS